MKKRKKDLSNAAEQPAKHSEAVACMDVDDTISEKNRPNTNVNSLENQNHDCQDQNEIENENDTEIRDEADDEYVVRARKIRLYPTTKQKKKLSEWFGAARWVYNQCVEAVNTKKSERKLGVLRNLYVNSEAEALRERQYFLTVPYEVRSDAVRDALKAFTTSFALLRNKKIDKFQVKHRSRRDATQNIYMRGKSFSSKSNFFYTTMFCDDTTKERWTMRSAERLPCTMESDCRLMRTKSGEYYLVVPMYKKKMLDVSRERALICAMDPGVRTFQTIYDPQGKCYEYGKQDVQRLYRLAHAYDDLQSRWSKKGEGQVKARKRYKMKRAGLRICRKIRDLVRDLHNKLAKRLCSDYETVIIPEFETAKMVRRGQRRLNSKTARAMVTWSHYAFRQRLISKAEEMGTQVEVVTEEYTSKTCGGCGTLNDALGGSKLFRCAECGYRADRDVNGARNILIKTLKERLMAAELTETPLEETNKRRKVATQQKQEFEDTKSLRALGLDPFSTSLEVAMQDCTD